jgi:hypothetical protein
MKNTLLLLALACFTFGCGHKEVPVNAVAKGPNGAIYINMGKGSVWFASSRILTTAIVCSDSPLAAADATDPDDHVTCQGTKVPITLQARTGPNGSTGTCSIGEGNFDLANGSIFLVTMADGKPKVQQLVRDLAQVMPNPESVEKFAKADQEIAAFLKFTGK